MSQPSVVSWRCRDFLSNAIVPAPLVVNAEDFMVMVGALLAAKDVPCVILANQRGAFESIYGYQLVNLILESKPEELYNQFWLPARRVVDVSPPSPLPTIQLDDECTRALSLIVANRFGSLLFLDDKRKPAGVLSLKDIVTFVAGKTKSIGIRLREVSSQLKLVDERESLVEVFWFMMRNRTRRVVIKRTGKFYCCTERDIMRVLFSLNGLQLLRDDPDSLLNRPIVHLVSPFLSPVPNLRGGLDVAEGWVHATRSVSCTVIVDDERVATPWDLVIKPFLAGRLPF